MAKATAICTCEKCGRTFEHEAVKRNRKEADSWAAWAAGYYTVCTDCEEKERREAAEEMAKKAVADGLPELIGTEKQVVWAEQIRGEIVEKLETMYREARETADGENDAELKAKMEAGLEQFAALLKAVRGRNYARWWIDHRGYDVRALKREMRDEIDEAMAEKEIEKAVEEKRADEPAPMVPENPRFGAALVKVAGDMVTAEYPRDDTFREIAKGAGFKWDADARVWCLLATEFTGAAEDRAAELIARLLKAGFTVRCADEKAREMAVNGGFQARVDRWVKLVSAGAYAGWLAVEIPQRGEKGREEMYEAARRIKGAKYRSGVVAVPVANHAMVEDFAEINGYGFSRAAREAIEKFEEDRLHPVVPAKVEKVEREDKLKEILQSSSDVLPDLVDDDESHN